MSVSLLVLFAEMKNAFILWIMNGTKVDLKNNQVDLKNKSRLRSYTTNLNAKK